MAATPGSGSYPVRTGPVDAARRPGATRGTLPRLHLITDDVVLQTPGFLETARSIIARYGGEVALHLRGHGLTGSEIFRLADLLAPEASKMGTALLINDRVDLALATGASGVQLGRRSLPLAAARQLLGAERWIGRSAHELEEIAQAENDGADYIVYGTIFPSNTHPGEATVGVEGVRSAARAATRPLIAIGGMNPGRVREIRAAGAYGVAVLGGVWHADRPKSAVNAFLRELKEEK